MKKGYTLIEVLLVCLILTSIVVSGTVLYSQYANRVIIETAESKKSADIASTFLALNDAVRNSEYITYMNNAVDLGNGVISISGDGLYLNSNLLISDNNISLEIGLNNEIVVYLGGERYCFEGVNTSEAVQGM